MRFKTPTPLKIPRQAQPLPDSPLVDSFSRRITYLRLSVIDRCDLRCRYCMSERQKFLPRSEVLSLEEMHRLALGFMARGVRKIRLTGGEPLMRRDMMSLVRALGRRIGVVDEGEGTLDEVTLTTNGTRLAEFADELRDAGVRRINVSLDSLDRARFARIARRDALEQVLAGIEAAKAAGLNIKINTVALKNENEEELNDLIIWAHGQGFDLTLIEIMPLGEIDDDRIDHYLPLTTVRAKLEKRFTLLSSAYRSGGPSHYVDIAETGGRLGFITPLTGNFCEGCNRVRVTATGQLFPCLGGEEQIDLRAALRSNHPDAAHPDAAHPDAALATALDRAMRIKPARHHFMIDHPGSVPTLARNMSVTGG